MWAPIFHISYVQILHNEPFNEIRGTVGSISDWVSKKFCFVTTWGFSRKNVSNCNPQFCTIWKINYLYSFLHHMKYKSQVIKSNAEWMNPADFYILITFRKAKSYSNSYWVSLVKYGPKVMGLYDLLHLKNEWLNWADFLHAHTYSGKLRLTLGAHGQIWLWPFRSKVSKISFIWRINW